MSGLQACHLRSSDSLRNREKDWQRESGKGDIGADIEEQAELRKKPYDFVRS